MSRWTLLAILVVLGAGWGITQPLAKIAVSEGYRSFGLIFWQSAIGAALMALVLLAQGRRRIVFSPRQVGFCALIALIGTVLPNGAGYQAAVHLPAGILSITLALIPMLAFPIALAFGIDRFGWARLIGLALGLSGVALIALPEASLPERAMLVFLPLALIAPLFYALEGNVVAKWGMHGLDPIALMFGASLMGMVLAFPLALVSGSFIDPRLPWGAPDYALILSSVVHVFVYATYVWIVGQAGAVFAAQVSYLVTGFGVLWAMAILGERFSGWVWAALGLMFLGLFLVQPRPKLPLASAPGARDDDDAASANRL